MADIPIEIELGEHGLYYGTSPAMRGLLVIGDSPEQVMERAPQAIEEMRSVASDHSQIESWTPRNATRIGHPRLADEDHPGCVYCQDVDPGARGCPHCGRYVPDTDQS